MLFGFCLSVVWVLFGCCLSVVWVLFECLSVVEKDSIRLV